MVTQSSSSSSSRHPRWELSHLLCSYMKSKLCGLLQPQAAAPSCMLAVVRGARLLLIEPNLPTSIAVNIHFSSTVCRRASHPSKSRRSLDSATSCCWTVGLVSSSSSTLSSRSSGSWPAGTPIGSRQHSMQQQQCGGNGIQRFVSCSDTHVVISLQQLP
jgi:hypothetical protein